MSKLVKLSWQSGQQAKRSSTAGSLDEESGLHCRTTSHKIKQKMFKKIALGSVGLQLYRQAENTKSGLHSHIYSFFNTQSFELWISEINFLEVDSSEKLQVKWNGLQKEHDKNLVW